MILNHHGINSLKIDKVEPYLVIGGKTYPVVVIGNRAWLQYNLDYAWSGLTVDAYTSSSTNPVAAYPGNDNRTWGWGGYKAGLLYNRPAINYVRDNILPQLYPKWRVPNRNDFGALFSNDLKDLLSTTFSWTGNPARTNSTGFTAVGGAYRTGSYEPSENKYSISYMAVVVNNQHAYASIRSTYSSISSENHSYFYSGDAQLSIRLVRDLK